LARGLALIENARMEWNAARLKFVVLSGKNAVEPTVAPKESFSSLLATADFAQLCKVGFALTWPIALAVLAVVLVLVLKH
jgi:hypothetical protein